MIDTKTKTTTDERRRATLDLRPGYRPTYGPLIPLSMDPPAAVKEGHDVLVAKSDAAIGAVRTRKHAANELEQAERADKAADTSAELLGEGLPTVRASTKARQALDLADRKVQATDAAWCVALEELTAAIEDHRDEWRAAIVEATRNAHDRGTDALAILRGSISVLEGAAGAQAMLDNFEPGTRAPWCAASFGAAMKDPARQDSRHQRRVETARRATHQSDHGEAAAVLEVALGSRP